MFAASKSGSADAKDANFKNVTMLLHGNGTNGAQNNTFVDSSTNNFTITRNGNTTQGTFSPYGSNWSNYFDGSGDTLNTASNAAFGFGSGAWTFEAWVYPTTSQTDNWIIATNDAGKLRMRVGASGYLSFYTDTGSISLNSTTVVTVNAWSHVAICYDGTTLSLYQNGTRTATSNVSISNGSANSCYIGSNTVGGGYWNGYISNARVVKGSAVYSGATYTVPTSPLTAISGTSLLTCADNRFIDDSTNNFTITKNGDVSVQRFSPFSPTTAYSTSVIGGSGYFDGSGDYLTAPNNTAFDFGSGSFTLEAMIFPLTTTPSSTIFGKRASGAVYGPFNFGFGGTLSPAILISFDGANWGVNISSSVSCNANAWNHIAVTRNGSTFTIWVNGVSGGTASNASTVMTNTAAVSIGATAADGTSPFNGYIADARIVKGTAVYTSAFTPPTAPLTAVTNTQLLLSYTNAGILDNAMMNDLETVGNAQISTSVKKYGTGSLAFDGTGDWLSVPDSQNFNFGSGNFTIEFWIYLNSVSGTIGILGKRTNEANYAPFIMIVTSSALKVYMSINGSLWAVNGLSTSTLSTSTWYNIAVTRSGSTVYMFLNGTSVGSTGTLSGALMTNTSPLYIGADSGSPSGSSTLNGYIDDLRITKGVARYTANFTAPTAPFPDKG